jgi:hypothetical protein
MRQPAPNMWLQTTTVSLTTFRRVAPHHSIFLDSCSSKSLDDQLYGPTQPSPRRRGLSPTSPVLKIASMKPRIFNERETQITNDRSSVSRSNLSAPVALGRKQHRGRTMTRHPIESNFYASVSDTSVEVTFAPTRSIYAFNRPTTECGGPLFCVDEANGAFGPQA